VAVEGTALLILNASARRSKPRHSYIILREQPQYWLERRLGDCQSQYRE